MAVPVAETVADAVAAALRTHGDFAVPVLVLRTRFPKYELKDLNETKINVLANWPAECDPHDRGSTATDQRIAVTLLDKCEKTNITRLDDLTALGERIAGFLAQHNVAGAGLPLEALIIDRFDEQLDHGMFAMYIGLTYRIFREVP